MSNLYFISQLLYKKFVRGEMGAKSFNKTNEHVAEKVDVIMNVGVSDDQSILSADTFGERLSLSF